MVIPPLRLEVKCSGETHYVDIPVDGSAIRLCNHSEAMSQHRMIGELLGQPTGCMKVLLGFKALAKSGLGQNYYFDRFMREHGENYRGTELYVSPQGDSTVARRYMIQEHATMVRNYRYALAYEGLRQQRDWKHEATMLRVKRAQAAFDEWSRRLPYGAEANVGIVGDPTEWKGERDEAVTVRFSRRRHNPVPIANVEINATVWNKSDTKLFPMSHDAEPSWHTSVAFDLAHHRKAKQSRYVYHGFHYDSARNSFVRTVRFAQFTPTGIVFTDRKEV